MVDLVRVEESTWVLDPAKLDLDHEWTANANWDSICLWHDRVPTGPLDPVQDFARPELHIPCPTGRGCRSPTQHHELISFDCGKEKWSSESGVYCHRNPLFQYASGGRERAAFPASRLARDVPDSLTSELCTLKRCAESPLGRNPARCIRRDWRWSTQNFPSEVHNFPTPTGQLLKFLDSEFRSARDPPVARSEPGVPFSLFSFLGEVILCRPALPLPMYASERTACFLYFEAAL